MVPGVVGRPSTAAAPAGRLRIAHGTGQHRRPRFVDAALRAEPDLSVDERGTNWSPPAERAVVRQLADSSPCKAHPLRAEPFASCLWQLGVGTKNCSATPWDRFR